MALREHETPPAHSPMTMAGPLSMPMSPLSGPTPGLAPVSLPELISRLANDASDAAHVLDEKRVLYRNAKDQLERAEMRFSGAKQDLNQALIALEEGAVGLG